MNTDDKIGRILSYDPIGAAREMTGERDSPATDALSLMLVQQHAAVQRRVMQHRDDTYGRCSLEYYLRISEEEGFFVVEEGERPSWIDDEPPEPWRILWHPDGVLLWVKTWTGLSDGGPRKWEQRVDGADLHFNLLWNDGKLLSGVAGSSTPVTLNGIDYGCMYTGDPRNGLRYRMRKYRQGGAFMNPWVFGESLLWSFISPNEYKQLQAESPHPALERKDKARAFAEARVRKWPKEVQDCVALCFADDPNPHMSRP